MRDKFEEWRARLKYIRSGEFPFGPIQEFRNEEGRLHRDDGPAYITPTRVKWYRNGRDHGIDVDIWGSMSYWYEGVWVPRRFIMEPETITVDEVLSDPNAEVRYAGIRIIGYDTLLADDRVTRVHEDIDRDGRERVLFEVCDIFPNPFKVVKVENSSPEPDGTFKKYFLNVPNNIQTCQSAVAWTFGMDGEEYNPAQET